jgi:hypothetical protein
MKIDQIKTWIDVIAAGLTTCAILVGGSFGAYQFLEQAHDGQVKETLNFLDRYNREPVAQARMMQQKIWREHLSEEKRTAGKNYDRFAIRIILKENLEPSIVVLNDFYAALEICSRNKICDPEVALQLFQESACSFYNRHVAFLALRRKESGDNSIGLGTELFATDVRGADTVSCISRPEKWYKWFARRPSESNR